MQFNKKSLAKRTDTLKDAQNQLLIFQEEIQSMQSKFNAENLTKIRTTPIERNKDGYACIKTTQGEYFLVSDQDYYDLLCNGNWRQIKSGYIESTNLDMVLLHRFIMKPEFTQKIDHINNDRVDNRRTILRVASSISQRVFPYPRLKTSRLHLLILQSIQPRDSILPQWVIHGLTFRIHFHLIQQLPTLLVFLDNSMHCKETFLTICL
jgi:hypothetical protein